MNLDLFWERIFSEDASSVRAAWASLSRAEQREVRAFLQRAQADEDRLAAQRFAAQCALGVIDELPSGALAFARSLAHETGVRLRNTERRFGISAKADGTLVTTVDTDTDTALCQAIQTEYPAHGVLSEEHNRMFGDHEWCWVIDPIDGTTNFSTGFPVWGVLIGLLHYGEPAMGVAEFPPLAMQYHAARGKGAWLNDAPIRVASETGFNPNQLFAVCSRAIKRAALQIPGKARSAGSIGFDLCAVASGACVGSLDLTAHVWDIAAVSVIVSESGGHMVIDPGRGRAPLFPLQPGIDYTDAVFTVLAACTPELLRDAQARLAPIVMS